MKTQSRPKSIAKWEELVERCGNYRVNTISSITIALCASWKIEKSAEHMFRDDDDVRYSEWYSELVRYPLWNNKKRRREYWVDFSPTKRFFLHTLSRSLLTWTREKKLQISTGPKKTLPALHLLNNVNFNINNRDGRCINFLCCESRL